MEERGFFCFMAPVYLLVANMLLTFLIIFTPSINPSKTAMPVLKARIMALPLSAAGARGANSSLAVSVMISFCACIFFRNSFFCSAILSRVMEEESGILFMMVSFFIIILKEQSGNEVHHWIDDEFLAESDY